MAITADLIKTAIQTAIDGSGTLHADCKDKLGTGSDAWEDSTYHALYTWHEGLATVLNENFVPGSSTSLTSGRVPYWNGSALADSILHANATDLALNDQPFRLRTLTDPNHILRWCGPGAEFESFNPDGPVLHGNNGGMLGSMSGGERVALRWDQNRDVYMYRHLYLSNVGDCSITINADTDNSGEDHNAWLRLVQDGTAVYGTLGLVGNAGYDPEGNVFAGTGTNYLFVRGSAGITIAAGSSVTTYAGANWTMPGNLDVASQIRGGEIISDGGVANTMRCVWGNYGYFVRNDGSNVYFMLTNSGDQYGGYNSYRPFRIACSTGDTFLGNSNVVAYHSGTFYANKLVRLSGGAGDSRQTYFGSGWMDASSAGGGAGIIGANMYVNQTANTIAWANTHASGLACGMITNYPSWNQITFTINSQAATAGSTFTPDQTLLLTENSLELKGFAGSDQMWFRLRESSDYGAYLRYDGSANYGFIGFTTTADTDIWRWSTTGEMAWGVNGAIDSGVTYVFYANQANTYAMHLWADGNNSAYRGLLIRCGNDAGSGTNYTLIAADGDGTGHGSLAIVNTVFSLTNWSDERLKKDIAPTEVNGLEVINNLDLIQYRWDTEKRGTSYDGFQRIGFRAQNAEQVFPEMVSEQQIDRKGKLSKTFYKMTAGEPLIPVIVKSIQELSAENEELKARIAALEAA